MTQIDRQVIRQVPLLTAETGNDTGQNCETRGFKTLLVDVQKLGTGTVTLTIQGSMDGVQWYTAAVAPIDGQTSLTYVSSISVAANGFDHVYQVRDPWAYLQAVTSAVAGAVSLNATLYATPV